MDRLRKKEMDKEKSKLERVKSIFKDDSDSSNEARMFSRDLISLLQDAMLTSGNTKLSKAVAIGSAAWTVGTACRGFYKLYKRTKEDQQFLIKITEDEDIFEIVEDWLMGALPEEEQRSVYAISEVTKTNRKRRGSSGSTMDPMEALEEEINAIDDPFAKDRVVIDYSFDGTVLQELTIAGHQVKIFTTMPEHRASSSDGGGMGGRGSWNSRSINIECATLEARNAVLDEIENKAQYLIQSQPRMFVTSKWGDWRRRSEIQPRARDSVVLKEGQMERILGYLNGFLANREAFQKVDIPYRTGILLHGEPGSGKSSTALAIANELKMNVYIVSLTSLLNDDALNDAFSGIPANSIVVLEDIDITAAVRDRDKDDDGVTMTGMLNVLDGFQSPPGVITIMTTNRLDVLDDAIKRPGRMDLQEELNCLDTYQLHGLCRYFMGFVPEGLPDISPSDGISSAEVMGVVRKHLPDFENAGPDMVKFIEKKKKKKIKHLKSVA